MAEPVVAAMEQFVESVTGQGLTRHDRRVAEGMAWVGASLVMLGVVGFICDVWLLAWLTPTAKGPDRPGDLEARQELAQFVKIEAGAVALGAALLFVAAVLLLTG